MYMIEITEDKLHSIAEYAEHGLKCLNKLTQCIEDLEESSLGAYGEKGRLGLKESEGSDWWDEEDRRYRNKYNRMRRY